MITYRKEGVNVIVTYQIVYYDKHDERHVIETHDEEEAMSKYMVLYCREDVYGVYLADSIEVDGEVVLERFLDPKTTTFNSICKAINDGLRNECAAASEDLECVSKELEVYKGYVALIKEEVRFKQYEESVQKRRRSA